MKKNIIILMCLLCVSGCSVSQEKANIINKFADECKGILTVKLGLNSFLNTITVTCEKDKREDSK